MELSQVVKILRRHARFIFAFGAIALVLTVGVTLLSRMRFMASATLYLGELETDPRVNAAKNEIELSPAGHGEMGSEVEILKSRSLITQAILASGLNVSVLPAGARPPRYWQWLWSGRSERLLDVADRELSATGAVLADRSLAHVLFNVAFTTGIDYELTRKGRVLGRGRLGEKDTFEGLTLQLGPGTEGGPVAGARYDLDVESLDDVIGGSLKALDIATPKATSNGESIKIATLHFTDRSPRKAASFLRHLISNYLEEHQAWKTEDASAAEVFVTQELAKTRVTLDDLQNKLAAYRSKNGMVVLDADSKEIIAQVGEYEQQRVAARVEVDSLAKVDDQLKTPDPPVEAFMVGEAKDDSVLTSLATGLSQSQQKLAEVETRYNAPAPEAQAQRAQVDAQLNAIRKYVSSRLARARESLSTLDGVVAEFERRLKTVPGAEVGLAQLTRESEVYSTMYSALLRQQQETALVKASTISKDRVLDAPEVPYREETPKLLLTLAAGPIGLLLGAVFVVVRSLLSGRIQSDAEVRKHLGPVQVFAMIPRIRGRGARLSPACLEAFRTLRANLNAACGRDRGSVVLFTSPYSGDGKTTCAYWLASTLARSGRSVLLVDAGLRSSTRFDPKGPRIKKARGLGDVLMGQERWQDVLTEISVANGCSFRAIGGGETASTDLLSSNAMLDFVSQARLAYDFVLLEAPSYPAVSDTYVLAGLATCVVSVLRLEHTSRALASENVRQLLTTAPAFGVVVNDVVA
jgi:tyrosine-protein kinase Etk/Wzc